jgi:hypothetical protein
MDLSPKKVYNSFNSGGPMKHLKAVALLLALFSCAATAQTITASITGTVSDASGARVPNATITATNVGTNLTYTATTSDSGLFNLVFLPVGQYTVSSEIQGFKKTVLGPFQLEVNQVARVDLTLEVGETTQSVEIKDFAPVLQTDTTETGATLSANNLTSLPLNGRNFVSLTLLMPGAVSPNPSGMNGRFGATERSSSSTTKARYSEAADRPRLALLPSHGGRATSVSSLRPSTTR